MAIPPESLPQPASAVTATRHGAGDAPGHTELMQRYDRIKDATGGLQMLGFPVEDLLGAGLWLTSFAAGGSNYAGLGPGASAWLAVQAGRVLDLAAALAVTSLNQEERAHWQRHTPQGHRRRWPWGRLSQARRRPGDDAPARFSQHPRY